MKLDKNKHEGKSGIYCIRNLSTGKVYIGKAKCIYRRIKDHITRLNRKYKDENPYLINAWHKYGKQDFEYFVLEYIEFDEKALSERELFWMKEYKSLDKTYGYNLRLDSSSGLVISESTRKKMQLSQIRRFQSEEERKKCSHDFWKRNPDKLKEMSKKVSKLNIQYKIEQYDKSTGNLIETWDSIIELIEKNPSYKKHNIYAVCSGEKPSMYGFIWKKVKL